MYIILIHGFNSYIIEDHEEAVRLVEYEDARVYFISPDGKDKIVVDGKIYFCSELRLQKRLIRSV